MSELPQQYRNEWFMRSNHDNVYSGMCLYDRRLDLFFTIMSAAKHTLYVEPLGSDDMTHKNRKKVREQLYDRYIPCEVRA